MNSNGNDLISIIVPMFNSEKTIFRCVNSLQNQTYPHIEIILIDDGSTDNTGKICKELESQNQIIKLVCKSNGGVSSSRNLGLKYAKGKYICFVDSDDAVQNDYIKQFLNAEQKSNADLVWCGFITLEKDHKETNCPQDNLIESHMFEQVFLDFVDGKPGYSSVFNKMFKKSIIDKYNICFDEKLYSSEDMKFVLEYLKYSSSIQFVSKPEYLYYYEASSLTHTFNSNHMELHENWKKILKEYKRYFYSGEIDKKLDYKTIIELMSYENIALENNMVLGYKQLTQNYSIDVLLSEFSEKDVSGIFTKIFFYCLKKRNLGLYIYFYKIRKTFRGIKWKLVQEK